MADGTKIEWTDATWNPIVGCSILSPGCTNCYAMRLAGTRLKHHPSRVGLTTDSKAGPVWTGETRFDERALLQPLRWRRPRKIFVCAHSDLSHPATPNAWIDKVFAVMALAPQHTFQVLTKRPERMRDYMSDPETIRRVYEIAIDIALTEHTNVVLIAVSAHEPFAPAGPRVHLGRWPLPNVWLGVTAERQQEADERIPGLLDTPAAKRFVSIEPMLGAVDLRNRWLGGVCRNMLTGSSIDYHDDEDGLGSAPLEVLGPRLDWVICGGESGPNARPMHPDWPRSLRDQCAVAGVPFFMKQMGGARKQSMPSIPDDVMIREFPHD